MSERVYEIGLQFGNTYWKFLKFVSNRISKDAYLILPIPDVGLKLSIHSPKPPVLSSWHAHWSSDKLEIHEDVDDSFVSPEYWKESALEFFESFKYSRPSNDEDVIVLRTNFLTDALKRERLKMGERTIVDIGKFLKTMCKGRFYYTKAKKLPRLIHEMMKGETALNPRESLSIVAASPDRMILPLSSKTMIEFDYRKFMERLGGTSFESVFNPMQRAIETISRTNPTAFQRWLPSSSIELFSEETMNVLKQSKPEIVYF